MHKKGFKGCRCEKRTLSKCQSVCRTYNEIQYTFADMLERDPEVKSFDCNVLLNNFEEGDYCTDFVITLTNGDVVVRECIQRNLISKPMNVRLLNASLNYWRRNGVNDWGIVTNEKNSLFIMEDSVIRVLSLNKDEALIIDCIKKTMPKWVNLKSILDLTRISEQELLKKTNTEITQIDSLDWVSKRFIYEHYSLISPLLSVIGDKK